MNPSMPILRPIFAAILATAGEGKRQHVPPDVARPDGAGASGRRAVRKRRPTVYGRAAASRLIIVVLCYHKSYRPACT